MNKPAHRLVKIAPYESQLVADFHRELGRLEIAEIERLDSWRQAQKLWVTATGENVDSETQTAAKVELQRMLSQKPKASAVHCLQTLSNAQNPLDHLVGDLIGKTSLGRYFIIEFKRYASGFVDEATPGTKAKADRVALMSHLDLDAKCADLASRGHFGAYWNDGTLRICAYAELANGNFSESISTAQFYAGRRDPGKWWSAAELHAYLGCMTAHGVAMQDDGGQAVFGYVDQQGNVVTLVEPGKVFTLIAQAFMRAGMHQLPQAISAQSYRPGRPS